MEVVNSVCDHKGSISLRAQETATGYRFFFDDDDDESYFDLNLEKMRDSEEFEFQISFSPLPAAGFPAPNVVPADDEPLRDGRILPPQGGVRAELPDYEDDHVLQKLERLEAVEGIEGGSHKLQPGSAEEDQQRSRTVPQFGGAGKRNRGPPWTRKTSKPTTGKVGSGVMKFLVKVVPSEMIRSMFMLMARSFSSSHNRSKKEQKKDAAREERSGIYKRMAMHFSGWLWVRKWRSRNVGRSAAVAPPQRRRRRPGDVDLDEDIVRSILAAVDFGVGSRGAGRGHVRRPRQSPPLPRNARKEQDAAGGAILESSSITSAIAHCKMSYNSRSSRSYIDLVF